MDLDQDESHYQSEVRFESKSAVFYSNNSKDHIQASHRKGMFYEQKQLLLHRDLIPMQSTVLDIGANIGNHTIFYALHTHARIVYPFEPNPSARMLLDLTTKNNKHCNPRINTSYVNHAVGAEKADLAVVFTPENNLGGTRLGRQADQSQNLIECVALDDSVFEGQVSFLKIDVEGMEMEVLKGAVELIAKNRPSIAIEIKTNQELAFWSWLDVNEYHVVGAFFDYLHFKNYVAIPKPKT